jgi:hypothetical protein
MNLETILSDAYYIQIHKLSTIEYLNTIVTNWCRTLKFPAQDLSLSQLIGIYPRATCQTWTCDQPVDKASSYTGQHNTTQKYKDNHPCLE